VAWQVGQAGDSGDAVLADDMRDQLLRSRRR
jgi:hypothetical protein